MLAKKKTRCYGVALQAAELAILNRHPLISGDLAKISQDFAEEILKDLGVSKRYDSIYSGSGILLCHNIFWDMTLFPSLLLAIFGQVPKRHHVTLPLRFR